MKSCTVNPSQKYPIRLVMAIYESTPKDASIHYIMTFWFIQVCNIPAKEIAFDVLSYKLQPMFENMSEVGTLKNASPIGTLRSTFVTKEEFFTDEAVENRAKEIRSTHPECEIYIPAIVLAIID